MPKIALNSYVIAARDERPQEITIPNIAWTPILPAATEGQIAKEHPALQLPAQAVTTLYGFRDALAELSRLRRAALANHQAFYTITIDVDIPQTNHQSRLNLKKLQDAPPLVLYLDRLSKDLEEEVRKIWQGFIEQQQIPPEDPFRHGHFVTHYPALISGLRQHALFEKVEIFCYRLWLSENKSFQVASLFSTAHVKGVVIRGVECRLMWPFS